jgi:hypothetical protein
MFSGTMPLIFALYDLFTLLMYRLARENSPAIIFIDEIDAIATKRFDAQTGADREVQRILMELLNQMDGFDQTVNVKVSSHSFNTHSRSIHEQPRSQHTNAHKSRNIYQHTALISLSYSGDYGDKSSRYTGSRSSSSRTTGPQD